MKIHKGCGGDIVNRVCKKCGKKFNLIQDVFYVGLDEKEENKGFNSQAYRERLRSGKDIKPK